MSGMNSNESFERLWEGLSRAASCCRELGVMTTLPAWKEFSKQLIIMRHNGKVMRESPALSEPEINAIVTNMEIAQIASKGMQ